MLSRTLVQKLPSCPMLSSDPVLPRLWTHRWSKCGSKVNNGIINWKEQDSPTVERFLKWLYRGNYNAPNLQPRSPASCPSPSLEKARNIPSKIPEPEVLSMLSLHLKLQPYLKPNLHRSLIVTFHKRRIYIRLPPKLLRLPPILLQLPPHLNLINPANHHTVIYNHKIKQ